MTIETAGSTPAQPVLPAAPAKNVFQRIAGVFFAPEETFSDIARRPDILWPLLIIVLVGYVTTFVMVPHLSFDSVFAAQEAAAKKRNPNVSEADLQQMARIGEASTKVMSYAGPVLSIAGYLLMALVLWGATRMMGGQGEFKQAFSATLYAWMPLLLFRIILTIVAVARGTLDVMETATVVKSNPAFLVDLKAHPVLASFLSSFDVFTIWMVVLLIFGFAALSKLSKGKTAAIVLSCWIILIVLKVGFAALGAAMNG
jgi:hypothetical protein